MFTTPATVRVSPLGTSRLLGGGGLGGREGEGKGKGEG